MASLTIDRPIAGGNLDVVELETTGLLRLIGWSRASRLEDVRFDVGAGGTPARMLCAYRLPRADVAKALRTDQLHLGFGIDYLLAGAGKVSISHAGKVLASIDAPAVSAPDYATLFSDPRILRRDDIYSSGPPSPAVHPEVLAFARVLRGKVLDLGCGSGALVRELRAAGVDAIGLELDRPEIRQGLREDVREHIVLYDGSFPVPFGDHSFDWVSCSEVLEHLPDPVAGFRELARVATKGVLVTVPDMSAIPTLFPQHVVPWHLLEATHFNFFTQASLEALLRSEFPEVTMARAGEFRVNGTRVYTSLVAICTDSASLEGRAHRRDVIK